MTLILGMLLDAVFGEPKWLWSRVQHPAILIGKLVNCLDQHLNVGTSKRFKGVLALAVLLFVAAVLGLAGQWIPGQITEVIFVAVLLAQKSLVDHVRQVASGLRMSLTQGRRDVAMIVGRDVTALDSAGIARSAIESGSENFSDGVIAPAFWFLIAGLPGLLIYKFTNTADSMIGYRNEKYEEFGWAAARFDDLINLIPARISALLIWLTAPDREVVGSIVAEASQHRSPNAGWPEAAMAYCIDIALSGPRSYEGKQHAFPYVNADGAFELGPTHIDKAADTLWHAWGLAVIAAAIIALF